MLPLVRDNIYLSYVTIGSGLFLADLSDVTFVPKTEIFGTTIQRMFENNLRSSGLIILNLWFGI